MSVSVNKSLCPNMFNTDGLFDEVWNSDPHHKCGPRYEYQQSDKALGATATKVNNQDLYNYAFRTQQSTQQNGPLDLMDTTGGNIGFNRSGVAMETIPMTIGNEDNNLIFNERLGRTSKSKEKFTENANDSSNSTNTPDFTTMPTSIQSGLSSYLAPYNRAPLDTYDKKYKHVKRCDVKKDITSSLDSFKDGLLYSITFGKKEKFCPCQNRSYHTVGKVIGIIIVVFAIWFAISALVSCCLYGKAYCDGCCCPEAWSGISPIYMDSQPYYTWGGNKQKSNNFFKTMGEVAVTPFVSLYNAIAGGNKVFGGSKNIMKSTNIKPKDEIL